MSSWSGVLSDIFRMSQAVVPTCFKESTIFPVPKKNKVTCRNDYHPITLTSVIMKCFERLVMVHIKASMPGTLDPLQFASKRFHGTCHLNAIHMAITHLDKRNTYLRMLFND